MMRARLLSLVALAAATATLPSCLSLKRTPEARFFVLRSLADPPTPGAAPVAPPGDLVGLLPVLVPGYLDRPQVVTWAAPGELRIDEFLRWAEPLDAGVSRTLAENLDALLPNRRVLRWPWSASTPLRCRVRVELQRFGPRVDGSLGLVASFAVLPARGERPLASRAVDLRRGPPDVPANPADAGAGVEAMSHLLLELAQEVAATVAALPAETSAGPP
jgi:uncharacterized lipoprotein YmbA